MTAANPIVESNVTFSLAHRTTRGGRHLIYRIAVIQQPEQARACGSGSKAQTDRRPVDPPPVCELRIFEGIPDGTDPKDSKTARDITFGYSANFFLYATLEHARAMAHGRVQNSAATTPPVLTGMPVSGMAYLDRPHEAGYFLFSDLSIRHEGRYRLTFNLYEQTKNEADFDAETEDSASSAGGFNLALNEGSFDHRMSIKSAAFSVYSAKKFPGLKESTALSKVVADQGCRVRIRREVRMRKREDKLCDDDDYPLPVGARASATPDPFRARSMSNSSDRSVAPTPPYPADGQRRSSGQDYPMTNGYHLQFGGTSKPSGQFAQPSFPALQQQQQQQHHSQQHHQQHAHQQHHHQQHHLQHAPQPQPPRHNMQPAAPMSPAPSSSPFQRHSQPSPYPPPPVQPAPYHAPSPSPAPYHGYSNRPVAQVYTPSRTMTPSHDGYDRRPSVHGYAAPSPSNYGMPMDHDAFDAQRTSVSYTPQHSQQPHPQQPHPQSHPHLQQQQPQPPSQRPYQPQQQFQMLPPAASLDPSQQQYGTPQHAMQQPLPPISSLREQLSDYPHPPPRPSTPAPTPTGSSKPVWHFNTVDGNIEAGDQAAAARAQKPASPSRAGSKRKLGNVFETDDRTALHNGERQQDEHHHYSSRPNWHETVNGPSGTLVSAHPDRPMLPCPKLSARRNVHEYPMNYYRANGSLGTKKGMTYLD